MATPNGAVPRDLGQRLERLEAQLRAHAAVLLRQRQLQVSEGDFVVKGGGDVILQDADGNTVWKASVDPIKTSSAWAENGATSIPTAWTLLGWARVDKPANWVGPGHFLLMANAGDTFASGGGNLSVQPLFRYAYDDGTTSGWFGGPAINSGSAPSTGGPAVATSFWASNFALAANVVAVDVGVQASRVGTEASATSGNWHVAASVIFKRG